MWKTLRQARPHWFPACTGHQGLGGRLLGGIILLAFSAGAVAAEPAPPTQIFADALLPCAARPMGAALHGTALAQGPGQWAAGKGVTIGDHGVVTSGPAGAHHAISAVAGTIRLQADVRAQGSGFTGVALGRGDLSGNFWANLSMVFYISQGRYGLTVGSTNLVSKVDATLLHTAGANHLDLLVDTIARTVTAQLNGAVVLAPAALPPAARLNDLTAAGFRFNEPITPGAASVSNYRVEIVSQASAGLEPADPGMCFVVPDKPALLRWHVNSIGSGNAVPYIITDYADRETGRGSAVLSDDHMVTLTRTFPRGYGALTFPAAHQTFGIVALEPQTGPADPFFCIDAGLSWLELNPARRAGLVQSAARCGIAMARERLGLGAIHPARDTFDWEGRRGFESMRKMYAASHLPILEILDGAGKSAGAVVDLPDLAATWGAVARHWPVWGAVEVANEPDLRPQPADNYVPYVQAISYAMKAAQATAPVVTGVFATIPPGPYFDACRANGMLEDSNAVSFHSYDRATDVESMVARYRTWLKDSGKEALPLWHSECGWSWTLGPDRPPAPQDAASALEITAKAVESRACGVATYFPFVYVYYEEGQKNFGMMGREATPLRSMAAYAMCIAALSGKPYLGDVAGLDASVKRARVFGGGKDCVAVLYTGRLDPQATVAFPGVIKRAAGADGRDLPVHGGAVPIPDGLTYVWMDGADLPAHLQTDTVARKLYAIGQHPLVQERHAAPLVFQFLAGQTPARVSARGYRITPETAHDFPLHVRIHNLAATPLACTPTLCLPGQAGREAQRVTVPARGYTDIAWQLDVSPALDIAQTRFIGISGQVETGIQPLPLAIPVVMEGNLEQHLKRHTMQQVLPITDLPQWKTNNAAPGTATFSVTSAGAWRMDVKFGGHGGYWAYPKLTLPGKLDPGVYSGLLIRARIMKPASGVAIIANSAGAPNFWVSDLFPADGQWHVVYVPFAEFKPGPNGTGNQNTRLNPGAWMELGIGMGSKDAENTLEVSHFIVVGGSDG